MEQKRQFALSTLFGPGFYKPTIRVKAIIKLKTCTPYWEISRPIDFTMRMRERKKGERHRDRVGRTRKDEGKEKKVRYVEQAECRGLIFACRKVHSHTHSKEDYLFSGKSRGQSNKQKFI